MFEGLTWYPDRVLLGELVFRLEQSKNEAWELGDNCLGFYKDRKLVDEFGRFWNGTNFRPRHLLEIGIWDGGSAAFWYEQLKPERLVAIDLADREDSPYFKSYLERRGLADRIRTRWRTDQADTATLRRIVAEDFGGELDLVIDDGSHLPGPTRASFELLFPLLPPGGLYIIEDWAWEHWPEFQAPDHVWAHEEGLSSLAADLVAATGSTPQFGRLDIRQGFLVIERGTASLSPDFRLADHIRRRPRRIAPPPAQNGDVKLIAFYLPQFHPTPENDRWWGKGYTEWTRVARARPQYAGHYQPHLPERLGFYDLRLPEVRSQQAALARHYGVHAFCYYYYWFGTKTLLERPLTDLLASGQPDFPFCLCWANESWTRRWDGAERHLLIEQRYAPELDRALIDSLLPYFRDQRYLKVNGAPLLVVYRPGSIPDPLKTTSRWRHAARQHGFPDLHLVAALTFGVTDPRPLGFDAAVEFPPHAENFPATACTVAGVDPEFGGEIIDFRAVVSRRLNLPTPAFRLYRTAMAGWDNTPRLGRKSVIFHEASPAWYGTWLSGLVEAARLTDPEHRLVFVNAWNEWAEGAHLEPDTRFGTGYLEATLEALAPRR